MEGFGAISEVGGEAGAGAPGASGGKGAGKTASSDKYVPTVNLPVLPAQPEQQPSQFDAAKRKRAEEERLRAEALAAQLRPVVPQGEAVYVRPPESLYRPGFDERNYINGLIG